MKSSPNSSTETGVPAWDMPRPGAEMVAVMSAPSPEFAAATVTVIVSVSPFARLLPLQVADGVPSPPGAPFAPPVVQVTPVTVAFVKTTALLKLPVGKPEMFASVAV